MGLFDAPREITDDMRVSSMTTALALADKEIEYNKLAEEVRQLNNTLKEKFAAVRLFYCHSKQYLNTLTL